MKKMISEFENLEEKKMKKDDRKKESVLYTILDRYQNFCQQAGLNSGDIELDERYLDRWFVY